MAGFQPSVWGPALWVFLHMAVLEYPKKPGAGEEAAMARFLSCLGPVLPCQACQRHYAEHLASHPPPLAQGRDAVFEWLCTMQRALTPQGGTEAGWLTPSQVMAMYEPLRSGFASKHASVCLRLQEGCRAQPSHNAQS